MAASATGGRRPSGHTCQTMNGTETRPPEPDRTITAVLTIVATGLAAGLLTPKGEPHHFVASLATVTAWVIDGRR